MTDELNPRELLPEGLRCFRRIRSEPAPDKRCGVWVMTGKMRGLFVHGDRNEIQPPEWSVDALTSIMADCVEEITPAQALAEVADWPEAQKQMRAAFARHGVTA